MLWWLTFKLPYTLGYVFLGFIILVIIGWTLFNTPKTTGEWLEMLFFLFPLGLVFAIIFSSRSHYNKVKDIDFPNSKQRLLDLNHVVIKKDVGFTPRLLFFEKDGNFIGIMKPLEIPWWMFPFRIFNESLHELFPLTYGFISHDEETQFTFRKTGWLKQVKLTIFDRENQDIGTYIQEELKALFRIKGKLYNEKDEEVLSIEASGFSGDFRWKDEEGKQWAYFYNGKFPHEYKNIFRDTHNDIVELSDTLSKQDKVRLLAVIGYLFMARVNSKAQ
ncbi:hypothetical protein D8M05_01740 [Oceanobacillus bengalensis]|uniref:Uncharacterized protein n=1 Tax=Oceanobacillus bengalensis TaxID=1435466 RepID=A0A494Z6F8_9BACI|nr:hypothetical protein D8M05_01740 [Oceanobacillus bengalensis]